MKAFQLFLIILLLISLNCKMARDILVCAVVKLSDEVCEEMYQAVLEGKSDSYISLVLNLEEFVNAIQICS